MLPRPSNAASGFISSKSKSLKPFSLLSFGIKMNTKQQLPPKVSNKDPTNSSKINQNRAINQDKKHKNLQDMNFRTKFSSYLDQLYQDMNNQNELYKQQNQKDYFLLAQSNQNLKIFSDQISQKSNLLKLNNITNMDRNQKQSLKDNLFKSQVTSLPNCHFLQDSMFENENENQAQKIYVDMKKKIKKLSKSKRILHKSQRIQGQNFEQFYSEQQKLQKQMAQHHKNLMKNAFMDSQVIIDPSFFCRNTINHRIDNDVDTEDQQIKSGINKLKKALEEATHLNKSWFVEQKRFMQEVKNNEENQMNQYICELKQVYFC